MNKIYLLLVSLLLQGCDWGLGPSYDPTSETMYVDYYKEACNSTSTDMCFRKRFDTEDEFVLNAVSNAGFGDLEWGKRYTLQVEVEYDSGGDDSHYSLLSISNETVIEAATNGFVLALNMSSGILLDNLNNSWTLAGEDVFSCIESDCILLTNASNSSEWVQLEFSAVDDELTLKNVICSAAENDFASECEGINKTNWDIAHYQTDCGIFAPRLCLVYRDDGSSDDIWYILPFEITDFTASWGTEYNIQVETTTAGGAVRSASYQQENSNEDLSGNDFNVVMRTGSEGLEKSSAGVLSYADVEFDCETNQQCDLIDDAIDNANDTSERLIALLTRVEVDIVNEETQLIIQEITCDDSRDEFQVNCVDLNDDVIWIE